MAGALGLSEDEAWNTSPRLMVWMYSGLSETKEAQIQASWESARFVGYIVANVNGAKLKSPQRLAVFPWEKQSKGQMSKEDFEQIKKIVERWH